jgi:hypothetical protein
MTAYFIVVAAPSGPDTKKYYAVTENYTCDVFECGFSRAEFPATKRGLYLM